MARLYSHFFRTVQDIQGNIVPGVQGTITLADTPTLATLYGDPDGTIPLPNPLFNSTQYGSFSVYLDTGHYDMSFLKEGYVFEPLQDIQILEASGGVASLVGTPNRVLVNQSVGDIVLSTPQDLHPDASLQFAHLGLGTPANGSLGLLVATGATFQAPVTVSSTLQVSSTATMQGRINASVGMTLFDYGGDNATGIYSLVNSAGGTGRYAISCVGTAPVHFGGALNVSGGVSLQSTLSVAGAATLSSTLYVGGALTANTTIVANGQIQGGSFTTGGTMYCAGLATLTSTSTGNLYVSGTGTFDGLVNMGSTAGHKLNVGGNIYVTNSIGIGRGPEGGWSLTTNGGHLSYGAIQGNSTLYIATTGTFLGNVAICSTNLSTYQLFVNGTAGKIGGGSWADVSSRVLKREIADIPDPLGLLLAQRGRCYEWDEPAHAALLPGPQYGFIYDEVSLAQWKETAPDGTDLLTMRGFEALTIEALRALVVRLEHLERLA